MLQTWTTRGRNIMSSSRTHSMHIRRIIHRRVDPINVMWINWDYVLQKSTIQCDNCRNCRLRLSLNCGPNLSELRCNCSRWTPWGYSALWTMYNRLDMDCRMSKGLSCRRSAGSLLFSSIDNPCCRICSAKACDTTVVVWSDVFTGKSSVDRYRVEYLRAFATRNVVNWRFAAVGERQAENDNGRDDQCAETVNDESSWLWSAAGDCQTGDDDD